MNLLIKPSKICKACGEIKPLFEFGIARNNRDGRTGKCRKCLNEERLRWVHENPERRQAALDKYNKNNAERVKESKVRHYEKNKQKAIERASEWKKQHKQKVVESGAKRYLKNRDSILEHNKAWNKLNPDKTRIYCATRRARVLNAEGSYDSTDIQFLMKSQRGLCVVCGRPLKKVFHVDHIVAISKGGGNNRENLQLLHRKCNQEKNAKDPIEFMQSRGFLL